MNIRDFHGAFRREFRRAGQDSGFSLIELMVIVMVIGILATIAMTGMRGFRAKARQVEAKTMLAAIYTLEMAHRSENDVHIPLVIQGRSGAVVSCTANILGFTMSPCNSKVAYGYTVQVTPTGFIARATSGTGVNNRVYPGCAVADTWSIDQDKNLLHTSPADKLCN